MTTTFVPKFKGIGHGYAEMPYNGGRYRFEVKQYVDDRGERFGEIVGWTQIEDDGSPYVWIPSFGVEGQAELEHLVEEYKHEKQNPNPLDTEWWGEHRRQAAQTRALYDELRDERAKRAATKARTFYGGAR